MWFPFQVMFKLQGAENRCVHTKLSLLAPLLYSPGSPAWGIVALTVGRLSH